MKKVIVFCISFLFVTGIIGALVWPLSQSMADVYASTQYGANPHLVRLGANIIVAGIWCACMAFIVSKVEKDIN